VTGCSVRGGGSGLDSSPSKYEKVDKKEKKTLMCYSCLQKSPELTLYKRPNP